MAVSPEEYLAADFDAKTLRIADLRGLLLEYGVDFASNDKKPRLVALFNANVKNRANELKESRSSVVASGRGIQRVRRGGLDDLSDSSPDELEEEPPTASRSGVPLKRKSQVVVELPTSNVKPRQATSKKSIRLEPKSEDEEAPVVVKPVKRTISLASIKDTKDPRKRSRKTSQATSSINDVDMQEPSSRRMSDPVEVEIEVGNDSGFSDFNPFQSDAPRVAKRKSSANLRPVDNILRVQSPLPASRSLNSLSVAARDSRSQSPLNPNRRLSDILAVQKEEPIASPVIRKTRSIPRIQRHAEEQQEHKQLTVSPRRVDRRRSAPQEIVEESYQPEYEEDVPTRLKRSSAPTPAVSAIRKPFPSQVSTPPRKSILVRQPVKKDVGASSARQASWATLLITALCYSFWWRHERLAMGYCDANSFSNSRTVHRLDASGQSNQLALVNSPSLVDSLQLRPSCMPCPSHGLCADGKLLACERDYMQMSNPLALGNLLSLPDRCVPDTVRLTRIAEVASTLLHRLAQHKGEVICAGHVLRKGKQASEADLYGLDSESLMDELRPQFAQSISEQDWPEYFRSATQELVKDNAEAQLVEKTDGSAVLVANAAELPLACRAKLKTYEYASKRKTEISQLSAVLFAIYWLRSSFKQHRSESARVKELTNEVFRLLQEQKVRFKHAQSKDAFVGIARMRDQLLASEHTLSVRKRLWIKVAKIVESNDNIRGREVIDEGQDVRAWEWIGNADMLDSPATRHLRFENVYPSLQ